MTETETLAAPETTIVTASDLVETPPEPTAHVLQAGNVTPQTTSAPAVTPKPAGPAATPRFDSAGIAFDTLKHSDALHPTSGRWMPRKPKRAPVVSRLGRAAAPAASYVAPDTLPPEPAINGTEAEPLPSVTSITADTIIGVIQTALIMIGKDEGVLNDMEKFMLKTPLERCLAKYGVGEMPPEMELCAALAAIIIARLKKPKTAATWEKFKAWWGNWRLNARGRATARRIEEATA